eukprot:1186085-Prorocentrum_minimum.AAC.2
MPRSDSASNTVGCRVLTSQHDTPVHSNDLCTQLPAAAVFVRMLTWRSRIPVHKSYELLCMTSVGPRKGNFGLEKQARA